MKKLIIILALFMTACSGGGGGTPSGTNGGTPGGNDGGNPVNPGNPGVTSGYSGYYVHMGLEDSNFQLDNTKKNFNRPGKFAIEIDDEDLISVNPLKVGIYNPTCVEGVWYFNGIMVNATVPANMMNNTAVSIEISPLGLYYIESDVKLSPVSGTQNVHEETRQGLYAYTCENGKYTIPMLGTAYMNEDAFVLETRDGDYYFGLKRAYQITSALPQMNYTSYSFQKNGAKDACNHSQNYTFSHGAYSTVKTSSVNVGLSYSDLAMGDDSSRPVYVPNRTGLWTDYYKMYAGCNGSKTGAQLFQGISGLVDGKRIAIFAGPERVDEVDADERWYTFYGSSSLLIFNEE